MIKIIENYIMQNGVKIGYIWGDDIYNVNNTKIGSYSGNDIYNHNRIKIGYVQGEYVKYDNGNKSKNIKEIKLHVQGGTISDICRTAIYLLFGD